MCPRDRGFDSDGGSSRNVSWGDSAGDEVGGSDRGRRPSPRGDDGMSLTAGKVLDPPSGVFVHAMGTLDGIDPRTEELLVSGSEKLELSRHILQELDLRLERGSELLGDTDAGPHDRTVD